jgi:hypothetical protein
MKTNMGTLDKILRVVVAIVIVILYFTGTISGQIALGLGVLAAIFVLTSIVGICPLYLPFGINTTDKK